MYLLEVVSLQHLAPISCAHVECEVAPIAHAYHIMVQFIKTERNVIIVLVMFLAIKVAVPDLLEATNDADILVFVVPHQVSGCIE